MLKEYDIIVVGAGHAGCEAAAAAAGLGSSVLLITMNMNLIAQMSCNPSIGGIAKGQIVREIDALGGQTGIITDHSMIQFRMLNKSKGPAMWSPRSQCDRMLFSLKWREKLEQIPCLDFWQDDVTGIIVKSDKVIGVTTKLGQKIFSRSVILSNGTFLNGTIHIGEVKISGGRIGEFASVGITENLRSYGFESEKLKTGTPVRVDGRSLDFSLMDEQKGDDVPGKFSYTDTPFLSEQRSCFITYTNPEVHDILRTGFDRSPLFQGRIKGRGPRYCPSIEDKIERFSERERHQLFIEPEGWNTIEYYVNGFSSSLPDHIQYDALVKVPGFRNVKIFRPGYAIEYDYFPPVQLRHSLETRLIEGLYFAGQINGTTGYEEAAAQGLMAGINAHNKLNNLPPLVLKRSEAYIGVLIDDLITKGTDEPYRMFTSRAEYRVLLRQDNADIRLTKLGYDAGLATKERYDNCLRKYEKVEKLITILREESVFPAGINDFLLSIEQPPLANKTRFSSLLLRPQISLKQLIRESETLQNIISGIENLSEDIIEEAEILIKYEHYIQKEKEFVDKFSKYDSILIPEDFDYAKVKSLSLESREKFMKVRPVNLGQASRISGVSPADISVLLVYLGR